MQNRNTRDGHSLTSTRSHYIYTVPQVKNAKVGTFDRGSKSQAQCQHFAFHNLTSKQTSYRPHILHSYNSCFPALTEFKGILNSKRICQLEPSSSPPPNAHSPTFPSTAASYSLRDELPMSSILENKSQTITFQQRLKPNDSDSLFKYEYVDNSRQRL